MPIVFSAARWWQWPWTTTLASSFGSCQSSWSATYSTNENVCFESRFASSSSGSMFRSSSRKTSTQLGSSPTTPRRPGSPGAAVEDLLEPAPGLLQHVEVVERPAAAERSARELHGAAGGLQHLDGRPPDRRVEVVRERGRRG
ncbi:MAG TPA: hypothetical protein VFI18_03030 [Gaiellales bacterium]|nr:hypothetical protein [Gaiellales bacterium]